MHGMERCVVLALLLVTAGPATGQSYLPPGLELDEKGMIQWVAPHDGPCRACEGKKAVPCACDEDDVRISECPVCKGKNAVTCRGCLGNGTELDPYKNLHCPACDAGKEWCTSCLGDGHELGVGGKRITCMVCSGAGHRRCALCDGTGLLETVRPGGGDLRKARLPELTATMEQLRILRDAIEALKATRPPGQRVVQFARLIEQHAQVMPVPDGYIARMEALAEAIAKKPDDTLSMVSRHMQSVADLVGEEMRILQRALWRLRQNARPTEKPRVYVKAASLAWRDWFGHNRDDPLIEYTLLGRGFIMADSAPGTGDVINAWLRAHPDAVVIPISSVELRQDGKMIHCEVRDQEDSLNVHLVRKGCVAAGTQVSFDQEVDIAVADYKKFLDNVVAAEKAARADSLGLWKQAKALAESPLTKARAAMEKERWAEAARLFTEAVEAKTELDEHTWLDVAKCRDKAGDYKGALDAYDKAIGDGGWWPPYLSKAECITHNEGEAVARAWLRRLVSEHEGDPKFLYLLGQFDYNLRAYTRSIPPLVEAVKLWSAQHGFRFHESGALILDEKTMRREQNDFARLSFPLEYLSEACLRASRHDEAMYWATMQLSIGQQIQRCLGYVDEAGIIAGDVDARIVRAYVFMHQKDWTAAEGEIGHARVIAEQGSYTGWKRAVKQAEEALAERRE